MREMLSRIRQAKVAFNSKWTDKEVGFFIKKPVGMETRKRFLKSYIWSIALYLSLIHI